VQRIFKCGDIEKYISIWTDILAHLVSSPQSVDFAFNLYQLNSVVVVVVAWADPGGSLGPASETKKFFEAIFVERG